MKRSCWIVFSLMLGLMACVKPKPILPEKNSPDYKPAEQTVNSGETVYQQKCVTCHGSDGKLGVAGAKDITTSLLTLDERIELISSGKGAMPAFNATLKEEEIKNVAEYTISLK